MNPSIELAPGSHGVRIEHPNGAVDSTIVLKSGETFVFEHNFLAER
jgi:hypothetical protein